MTKFSGLTLAAAALTTHEWGVNEGGASKKVNLGQVMALLPQGTLGYAQIVANVTPFTTQADITGLTVTVTPSSATRRIRITGVVQVGSTVLNDILRIFIMEGATQLNTGDLVIAGSTGGAPFFNITRVLAAPTATAHTYKLQLQRAAGTGTVTVFGSATAPSYILVEDIGV